MANDLWQSRNKELPISEDTANKELDDSDRLNALFMTFKERERERERASCEFLDQGKWKMVAVKHCGPNGASRIFIILQHPIIATHEIVTQCCPGAR